MHKDVDDVYIWQVKGSTLWTTEGQHEDLNLTINQMIYIPAGVNHKPTVTMPRISVSFSIEHGAFE
jgi:mannose-6-phosphate isomerase-like protein (cupin superfamily)